MPNYQVVALDAAGHSTGTTVTVDALSSQAAAINALGQFWFDGEKRPFTEQKGSFSLDIKVSSSAAAEDFSGKVVLGPLTPADTDGRGWIQNVHLSATKR